MPWWQQFLAGGAGPALLIPSALLTLVVVGVVLDRRKGRQIDFPGCECGYNLTGNTSGVCPECGRPLRGGRRS